MAEAPLLICRAPGCGRQFRGRAGGRGNQPAYCSDVCRVVARQKHREAECARCGERFVLPRRAGRPPVHCSRSCREAVIDTLECTICGRSFDRRHPTGRLPKTCSAACRAEAARRRASAARAADGRPRPPRSAPRSTRRASLPVVPSEVPNELMAEIDEWFAAG